MDWAHQKRDRIKLWFKDRYNLALFLIVAAVFVYRFYWFMKVGNQPLWWDEADYLNIAKSWMGGAQWGFNPLRPIVLPVIAYLFYSIGLGEGSLRILMLLVSTASIPLIYLVGKTLFSKKAGIVSAFLLGIFWSWNFFTFRILVDIPVAVLWLATIYLFFDAYLNDKSWKQFALAGVFLTLAFVTKFSTITLIGIFGIYILATERLNVIRNKKIWAFALASFISVIPYLFWQYVAFGSPFAFYYKARAPEGLSYFRTFYQSVVDQVNYSIGLLHWALAILVVAGFIFIIYKMLLLWDKVPAKKTEANNGFFVFIWLILTMVFFWYLNYGQYIEERYFFIFYPAMFILAANLVVSLYEFGKKYSKYITLAVIVVVLAFAAYQNISNANQIIANKKDSFSQAKEAGLWLKENTPLDERVIVSQEHAEIQYYAERNLVGLEEMNTSKKIDDYILNNNAGHAAYVIFYPQFVRDWELQYFFGSQQFRPVKYYTPFLDKEQRLPIVTIFEIDKTKIGRQATTANSSLVSQ